MPFTSLPTVTTAQGARASWANLVKGDLDDHEARISVVEAAGAGAGDVTGPSSSVDNTIARYNGTTGKQVQGSGISIADGASGTLAGSNSGDVTLAGAPDYLTLAAQVITRALINLAAHVTGRLPYANLTASTAANRLLGRGSAGGAGDWQELGLGAGLAMVGNNLTATGGGGGGALDDLTDVIVTTPAAGEGLVYDGAEWINGPVGDVDGQSASVDSEIALFSGTGGKTIKRATGTGFVRVAAGVYTAAKLKRVVGLMIGDGTNVISTGVAGFVSVPVAGTIVKVRLLSSDAAVTSGSIVVDIWKDTYANYPPTVADTITASAKPTITTATNSEDSTLTGWTTAVAAGDVLGFKVDSVTSLKRVTVELTVEE